MQGDKAQMTRPSSKNLGGEPLSPTAVSKQAESKTHGSPASALFRLKIKKGRPCNDRAWTHLKVQIFLEIHANVAVLLVATVVQDHVILARQEERAVLVPNFDGMHAGHMPPVRCIRARWPLQFQRNLCSLQTSRPAGCVLGCLLRLRLVAPAQHSHIKVWALTEGMSTSTDKCTSVQHKQYV